MVLFMTKPKGARMAELRSRADGNNGAVASVTMVKISVVGGGEDAELFGIVVIVIDMLEKAETGSVKIRMSSMVNCPDIDTVSNKSPPNIS